MKLQNLKINKFLYLRAHIGHEAKSLDKTMNSFIMGIYKNISLLNNDYLIWSWERISHLLSYIYLFRLKFFVLQTNKNIPINWLKNVLTFQLELNKFSNNSFLGFLGSDWFGGVFSNWNKLWLFILSSYKKLEQNRKLSRRQQVLIDKLIDRGNKGLTPVFPDFLIGLTINPVLMQEARIIKMLSFGLVDSDKILDSVDIRILGNDDSLNVLIELFTVLEKAGVKSNRYHQGLFYSLVLKKLKNILLNV